MEVIRHKDGSIRVPRFPGGTQIVPKIGDRIGMGTEQYICSEVLEHEIVYVPVAIYSKRPQGPNRAQRRAKKFDRQNVDDRNEMAVFRGHRGLRNLSS